MLGDHVRSAELSEHAIQLCRLAGDRRREAIALSSLAHDYERSGKLGRALELVEQSIAIAEDIGDRLLQAEALNSLGSILSSLTKPDRAVESHNLAANIYEELGVVNLARLSLISSAMSYLEKHDEGQALQTLERARRLAPSQDEPGFWMGMSGYPEFFQLLLDKSLGAQEKVNLAERVMRLLRTSGQDSVLEADAAYCLGYYWKEAGKSSTCSSSSC
jgi:tetratricopeptide (TPR) repeat protein